MLFCTPTSRAMNGYKVALKDGFRIYGLHPLDIAQTVAGDAEGTIIDGWIKEGIFT
jgi:hypothetical protein